MQYFSRGKLLLTGEYLVIKGATSLAAPLKKGQTVTIKKSGLKNFRWESRELGKTWFYVDTGDSLFDILDTNDQNSAEFILNVLQTAQKINPAFLREAEGTSVVSDLDFKRSWGWGSSSSLIANIALWAGIDPFKLHQQVSEGSGYDVVCASAEHPILYTRDDVYYSTVAVDLSDEIKRSIYFVYQGVKQDSQKSVQNFLASKKSYNVEIKTISELSRHIAMAKEVRDLGFYVKEHEQLMASLLKTTSIKQTMFPDMDGEVKSLGAWGGDFAMIVWYQGYEELKAYLQNKKLNTFFSYNDIVKER